MIQTVTMDFSLLLTMFETYPRKRKECIDRSVHSLF